MVRLRKSNFFVQKLTEAVGEHVLIMPYRGSAIRGTLKSVVPELGYAVVIEETRGFGDFGVTKEDMTIIRINGILYFRTPKKPVQGQAGTDAEGLSA